MRDVVVVGAGHNGLVAACYLAREGLDVEVVERDTVVGGAVSTVERFPGYRVDRGSSAHVMIRHTGIVEELDLAAHGLVYDDLDPWGFAPFWTAGGDQVAITFWVDLDRTCASIAAVCGPADAAAYHRFVTDWGRRNEHVFAAFSGEPTPARVGRALWSAGRRTGAGNSEVVRQFVGSADALLDAHFRDDRLKTALAWMGSAVRSADARDRHRRSRRLAGAHAPARAGAPPRRQRPTERGARRTAGRRRRIAAAGRRSGRHPRRRRPSCAASGRRPARSSPPARSSAALM